MDWSKLSQTELYQFLDLYPDIPRDQNLSLQEQAQQLFEQLSLDPSSVYPDSVIDLTLASRLAPKLEAMSPYQIEDITSLSDQALLELGRKLMMAPNKISLQRILRVLGYLNLLSSPVSVIGTLSNKPVLESLCANISFPDAMNLREILKLSQLDCTVPITDPAGVITSLTPINFDTIKLYKVITKSGSTETLISAIASNSIPLIHLLIKNGANPILIGVDGDSGFGRAIMEGNYGVVKFLLDSSFGQKLTPVDRGHLSVYAVYYGKERITDLLLTYPINVNVSLNGGTPLTIAADKGHVKILQMLLDGGADPNLLNQVQDSALGYAASKGFVKIVKILLEKGADPNLVLHDQLIALFAATSTANDEIVKLLLEAGTNVNHQDINGNTPLIQTSVKNNETIIKLLLDHGADPNLLGIGGISPLSLTISSNNETVVKMLLDSGANSNHVYQNQSMLTRAVIGKNESIVRLLLEHGANKNFRDADGRLAKDYLQPNSFNLLELLE